MREKEKAAGKRKEKDRREISCGSVTEKSIGT